MVSYLLSKYVWGSREQERQRGALSGLCEELGLNLVKAKGLKPDQVVGEFKGWPVSVDYHQVFIGLGGAQNLTRFTVYYGLPVDFRFIINHGRTWRHPKRKRLAFQTSGSDMENNYHMDTNDESLFRQFLGHGASRELLRSRMPVRLQGGEHNGDRHSRLDYHVTNFLYETQALKTNLEKLVDVINHMRDVGLAQAVDAG